MTTPDDPAALVRGLLDAFNSRQFDQADDLCAPDFFSHPLQTTGFEAGKDAWRLLVDRFPDMRVVPEEILVHGDRAAVRSTVEGTAVPDGAPAPVLIEFFRVQDGRLAENWGSTWVPSLG